MRLLPRVLSSASDVVVDGKRFGGGLRLAATRRWLTSSYVEGPSTPPLTAHTLPSYFDDVLLKSHADRNALIARQERPRAHGGPRPLENGTQPKRSDCLAWSFAEFDIHIHALARGLLEMGVKKGDRVGVVMGNNSAYAMLQWACARLGAILVTVNPAYRSSELVATLKHVGVSTLVVVPQIRTSRYLSMLESAIPSLGSCSAGQISVEELPELRNLVLVDDTHTVGPGSHPQATESEFEKIIQRMKCVVNFRDILSWQRSSSDQTLETLKRDSHKDEVINLQFTSGTTGLPKAASLTHSNLLNNAMLSGQCMRFTHDDVLCNVPPLFHCFGNLAAWSHGGCIVYPSPIFDPPAIVDAILHEKCTALHGVPTHFFGVLEEVERRGLKKSDFKQLRTGIAAGSSVPIELMSRLIDQLGLVDLTNAYGMTETSPVSFQTTPDDPIIMRTESVGKPHPHVRAKLVNEDGEIVPIGSPGEICVSGYLLQSGYWNDEEKSIAAMKRYRDQDGGESVWMHTGDIGVLDEQGYLKVVGRTKDVIIRGGENLFPVRIDDRLHFHPEIREAAAVAVPDSKYGEVVGTFIVREPQPSGGTISKLSKAGVRAWVAEGMNPQNAPAWVWFLGEDGVTQTELPKTASGKIQKHILRTWAKELVTKGIGKTNGRS